ncbi:MAG: ATP-binding cassette domain-containing protein, partial [Pseudomonadota bacterium]
RALADLRAERAGQVRRSGAAALELDAGQASGKRVIEARGLSKAYGETFIVRDFDLRVSRGDRIAFVGPNGVGKTTLLKMLLGEVDPDAGSVKIGTGVEVAVFDQARAKLEPEATLWDSLTLDPMLGVSGASDQVMVRGTARHVAGYLKDFLFDDRQLKASVKSLSGGEKARLLLARIMALPSNLLVLDEPTNDLDVETLDLLQDVLGEYEGTVLLVSHDRDFLDRVATQTVAFEGRGRTGIYPGGWSDYMAQRGEVRGDTVREKATTLKGFGATLTRSAPAEGLSYTERHRLEELPGEMDRLGAEIAKLEAFLGDPELFQTAPAKFAKASEALVERQRKLAAAEEEWLALAAREEGG